MTAEQHRGHSRPQSGWRATLVITLGVLTASLLTTVVPATTSAAPVASSGAEVPGARPAPSHRITLVTGDVVTYTAPADTAPSATVEPAPRSGPSPVFSIGSGPNGYYVIPSDASPYVASGLLDRELFDVKELVAEGLDDSSVRTLPLILGYGDHPSGDTLSRRAHSLPSADKELPLPSAEAAAVRVDRGGLTGFWQALVGAQGDSRFSPHTPTSHISTDHISKVSLDRRVRASSDQQQQPGAQQQATQQKATQQQGTQQIGAPAAWAAGLDGAGVKVAVLDTGIDTSHPDLAGRVVDAANFTSDPDTGDGFGHGTHVAAILAGSGAASGGQYRGVADGVQLLNGKVLDNDGYGTESSVMAGMQWAVQAGARIVNMSLGAGVTDGTDPLSTLLDNLTAQTGVLFVVAAGNDGAAMQVETPAAAASALAVGAVDSSYHMASFSSAGPRLQDAAVKPEVTAPGVGIIAARAHNTSLGSPVDDKYTKMSGTSMATPHVAGTAALFAQSHPSWHAAELKALLTSSAKDTGAPWYQQGTGCVDVPNAMGSAALGPPAVSLGRLSNKDGKTTRAVTYTNLTDKPVELSVAVSMNEWDGDHASAGSARLDKTSVAIPANGQATVNLAVDTAAGPTGPYGGAITATTRDGVPIRSGVSFYSESRTFPLTATVTDSRGAATTPSGAQLTITRDDYDWAHPNANDPFIPPVLAMPLTNGTGTIQVPAGRYSTSTVTMEQDTTIRRANLLVAAETTVDGPTTISLDARKAVPVGASTGQPTDLQEQFVSVQRDLPNDLLPASSAFLAPAMGWQTYVTPTAPTRRGSISAADRLTLSQSVVDMEVRTPSRVALHPLYDPAGVTGKLPTEAVASPALVGSPNAADFDAAAVKNKLAVVGLTVPPGTANPSTYLWQAVQQAASAASQRGALALVPYVDAADALPITGLSGAALPVLSLSGKEGRQLAELAKSGSSTLSLRTKARPDYMDNLFFRDRNGISADQVRKVDHASMVQVPTRYHGDRPDLLFKKQWFAFPTDNPFGMALTGTLLRGPSSLTEYIGPADDHVYWKRAVSEFAPDAAGNPDRSTMFSLYSNDVFRGAGLRPVEDWFEAPIHGGGAQQSASPANGAAPVLCALCLSDTGRFVPALQWMDSTPGHTVDPWQSGQYLPSVHLFQDDKEIPAIGGLPIAVPEFALPSRNATYRLQTVDSPPSTPAFGWPSTAIQRTATQTTTSWTFRPRQPAGPLAPGYRCLQDWSACAYQPLLQVNYDLGLDLLNQAPAGRPHTFDVTVGYHSEARPPAQVTQLQLWYSTNDGGSWQQAAVSGGAGHYHVHVTNPALGALGTTGFVSLRLEASDLAGNRMNQTVLRAYALTDKPVE
ncbi:S8 family peptidase [Kutzneria sp. CA-103260]|uniref:S8 family peptidase n=1 Tax=Kutzneria sp. CA-103260 TaxID=2802641 RepID=UPI001BA9C2A0|nr:S8 family serine peptidase [Kutzneria sp. CA-103260]QUQ68718.1 peptidase [Kutzneria sp. CA-103260]